MARSRKSEAKRWFQQASYDLKASRWNIAGGFFDTASFLAQQGGEKALKSLLYYLGSRREALLTHSLVEMIRTIGKRVTGLPDLLEEGRKLDLHYVPSRYPNGLPSGYPHRFYGKETAEQALQAAQKIVGAVTQHYRSEGEEDILREEDGE
jgi:HEPN domain-containing protein